jgi:hypothetical protein
MIEERWVACVEPAAMVKFLRETDRLTERKARLFAVACCRHIWSLLDEHSRNAVEIAERYADRRATDRDRHSARHGAAQAATEARTAASNPARSGKIAAWRAAGSATYAASHSWDVLEAPRWACLAVGEEACGEKLDKAGQAEQEQQAVLLRHMVKPFRTPKSAHTRWRTPVVASLARQTYEHRSGPGSTFDVGHINRLYDALVDAGCREIDLIDHLGRPGVVHFPGCWAIDLILEMR